MFQFDFSALVRFGKNLVTNFDPAMKDAAQQVAKAVYKKLKQKTPRRTGQLVGGWDSAANLAFRVSRVNRSTYMVELTNNVKYANAVNYGHYSHNQFGGPYVVKHRTVPYYQGNNGATFVYGHFFVEKSILELEQSNAIEKIMNRCLRAWFRGCIP